MLVVHLSRSSAIFIENVWHWTLPLVLIESEPSKVLCKLRKEKQHLEFCHLSGRE